MNKVNGGEGGGGGGLNGLRGLRVVACRTLHLSRHLFEFEDKVKLKMMLSLNI